MNLIEFINLLVGLLLCKNHTIVTAARQDWWKNTIIYEIYIRSFKDSNGDGIGDLKGITSKLDHFNEIGVDTIWITPFYKSPMRDLGYDVSDYFSIDPIFGSMDDFLELMRETKKRGLKVIMDLVINHSSEKHTWFQKSINKIKPYTNYYIWKNPKGYDKNGMPIPPNNWLNVFGGSSWAWNQKRKQFYYHFCLTEQPDLNLRNPKVKTEVKKIIKFWLDKGVSGLRLDGVLAYMEDSLLRNEPLMNPSNNSSAPGYWDLLHIHTINHEDNYKYVHELREFIDSTYSSEKDEKILIAESIDWVSSLAVMRYYGNETYKMTQIPFNFDFVYMAEYPTPKIFDGQITKWMKEMPPGSVANWLVENHDTYRSANKFNSEFRDVFLITIMMLPGVASIYYGQEIGMTNVKKEPVAHNQHISLFNLQLRGRNPMQWKNSLNAGFTRNKKPWSSINSDYWQVNVETEKNDPNSRYNLFKTLSKLRREETLKYGEFKSYILSSQSYAFTRFRNTTSKDEMRIIVVMNLSFESDKVNLHKHIPNLPRSGKILTTSLNIRKDVPISKLLPLKFKMRPVSAIVLAV